ncbi:MAG TPA: hypothetical protein VFR48_09255 [Solirubrobacteraceae bacterium]|nr:hypothetical protein [Solirubrobacteraceae bacterium]
MSFFDDEDEEPPTAVRPARPQQQPRPQPRRPGRGGGSGAGTGGGSGGALAADHHATMVRRRIAAAVGVVLLIVIVLLVNGCLKRGKQQALEKYNSEVGKIAQESQTQVSRPLFATLAGASGKSALEVGQRVDEDRVTAEQQAEAAKKLSVPGSMSSAQRNFLLTMNMRVEGVSKIANLVRTALGGQAPQAASSIAGAMEIFLASDIVYSQRVVPLIQEALKSGGVSGQSTQTSRFLPNLTWLQTSTVQAKLTGETPSGGAVTPGTHGSSLKGVSVGTNTLASGGTLNHVSGGANPTFTVMVENAGSNPETNVKVDISVTSEGKTLTASHLIDKTEPGSTTNVDIPVTGVTLGAASRVSVNIEPVPGETDTENNKGSYLVIFQK